MIVARMVGISLLGPDGEHTRAWSRPKWLFSLCREASTTIGRTWSPPASCSKVLVLIATRG